MPTTVVTPYDKEFNITWFELAPSLQTLFLTLQSEMTTLQRNYTVLINTLDQLQIQVDTNTNNININAQEIVIIKQSLSTCQGQVDTLMNLIAGVDFSKIEDLSQLKIDMEQCLLDINQLFRRMRVVEKMTEDNLCSIVDLRTDVDNNTEWLNWLSKLTEDIPDLRTDIDNNTEWLSFLDKKVEELFRDIPDLRTDVDNNTEWLSHLQKTVDGMIDPLVDMQIDVDNNVVWMQAIHNRMEGFIDEIVNLRIDMDLLTEWYKEVRDFMDDTSFLDPAKIKAIEEYAVDIRVDVDENTERIEEIYDTTKKMADIVFNDFPDMRIDVDNNTEWLSFLDKKVEELFRDLPDMRIDIDNNTEWLNWVARLAEDVPDLRTDIDNNTEWLNRLDRLIDDVTDNTADIYQNIHDIQINKDNIEKNLWAIELNREDIDINTEMIDQLRKRVEELPDEIMEMVKKYVDSVRFLNLAPKINFNQEDIVEVTPYYYMNNMVKHVMTSDQDGAEVIYFIANDGVSTSDYDLYYGFRNNDLRTFYFGNKSVDPMCFRDAGGNKVSYVDDILTADNNYLIVHAVFTDTSKTGWYLIHTNNTRNAGQWVDCKKLDTIFNSSTVGAKYFEDYDVLVVFSKAPNYSDLKEPRIAVMRTYQYSSLSMITAYDIIHPMQIMTCNTDTTSFDRDSVQGIFLIGDVGDQGYGIDSIVPTSEYLVNNFKMLFTIYEEQELLVMELYNANILYTPAASAVPGNTSYEAPHCYIKLTFDCPKSIMEGGTAATLTCLQNVGDLVFDCADTTSDFFTKDLDTSYASISYAEVRDTTYKNWHEFETYYSWFNRYKNEEQRPDTVTTMQEYGTIDPYTLDSPLITPDASPWGKWIYKYTMGWDRFFINCSSAQGDDCIVKITDWVVDPKDSTALLPKAGCYQVVDPIQIFTEYGSSSCKMTDGTPRYFHTEFTGSELKVHEYTYVETDTDFIVTKTLIKTVPVSVSSWTSTAKASNNVRNPVFDGFSTYAFYNAVSDDFVIQFMDDTNNSSSWSYSDYGFLATVNSSGSIVKVFGSSGYSSSYSSKWTDINSYVQLAKSTTGVTPKVRNMTFLSATQACCCYFYNSTTNDSEDYRHVNINFNAAKTSMSMSNAYDYVEKQYTSQLGRGIGVIYSGPEYGLTFCGETLDHTYTVFLTQKKITSASWGVNYSEASFINGSSNRYKIQLKSSVGLIAYIPNIGIFLGGYFSQLENPLPVVLLPDTDNYIYMERDPETLEIRAFASEKRFIAEGARTFNRICIAKINTFNSSIDSLIYYKINNGYNDYSFT